MPQIDSRDRVTPAMERRGRGGDRDEGAESLRDGEWIWIRRNGAWGLGGKTGKGRVP